jgi:hypothetical protein
VGAGPGAGGVGAGGVGAAPGEGAGAGLEAPTGAAVSGSELPPQAVNVATARLSSARFARRR